MKNAVTALVLGLTMMAFNPVSAEDPPVEQLKLKDGSTLYLHADGTGRMVDQHGKPMSMTDGVEMETADGRVILMKNKRVWVHYGPPGKGRTVQRTD